MASPDRFEIKGEVIDVLKGAKFKVRLENGHVCTCNLSGKMRLNSIKIVKGDNVTVDLSVLDPNLENGRIIYRNK